MLHAYRRAYTARTCLLPRMIGGDRITLTAPSPCVVQCMIWGLHMVDCRSGCTMCSASWTVMYPSFAVPDQGRKAGNMQEPKPWDCVHVSRHVLNSYGQCM